MKLHDRRTHDEVVDGFIGKDVIAVELLPRLQQVRPFVMVTAQSEST